MQLSIIASIPNFDHGTNLDLIILNSLSPEPTLNNFNRVPVDDNKRQKVLCNFSELPYINEKFEDPVQALKKFLEATRWDLSEVEVKQDQNMVKFRCISTLLTGEATELLAKFIEGAMHSIGYQTDKSDTLKGMMLLDFKK